jgi:YidC/Oxa1 family membrane protein insertase
MDKNSWLGLILIVGIMLTWGYFTKPTEEEMARQRQLRDSIEQVRVDNKLKQLKVEEQAKNSTVIKADVEETLEKKQTDVQQIYGDFASVATGKREFVTVENKDFIIKFLNQGGRVYSVELKKYKTWEGKPLILFSGDSTEFGLKFFSKNRTISTNQLFFNRIDNFNEDYIKVEDHPVTLKYRLQLAGEDKYIDYDYVISPDSYQVDFDINMKGVNDIISSTTGYISLDWKSYITGFEKGESWEKQNTTIYYKFFESDVEDLSARSESENETLTTPVKWVSYKQQFFNTTLIADKYFSNGVVTLQTKDEDLKHLKYFTSELSLAYNGQESISFPMSFYFGPNHYKTLKKVDVGLENIIELGFSIIRWVNVGFIIPLFNWLGKFISNYGLVIFLLTIIIKIIIFPFTYKSYMSTAKMKALKPEIEKATEKYSKPEDAMKKQQATMALYKKVGVNPMGGCLPLLFQMPLLLAMFRFFPNSIELRQQSFLWATDLSTYDAVIHLPFTVPFGFGDHISLFALLMTVVNVVYMKFNDQMSMGNQQMAGMKYMMYMMPVMMLFWFNSYASALSYYYFLSLLITIIQTYTY